MCKQLIILHMKLLVKAQQPPFCSEAAAQKGRLNLNFLPPQHPHQQQPKAVNPFHTTQLHTYNTHYQQLITTEKMQFTKMIASAITLGAAMAITGDLTYYNAGMGTK